MKVWVVHRAARGIVEQVKAFLSQEDAEAYTQDIYLHPDYGPPHEIEPLEVLESVPPRVNIYQRRCTVIAKSGLVLEEHSAMQTRFLEPGETVPRAQVRSDYVKDGLLGLSVWGCDEEAVKSLLEAELAQRIVAVGEE